MKASHALETAILRGLLGGLRAVDWRRSLAAGAALGGLVGRLGIRRRVADANLALAFPEWSADERAAVLRAHYRELGRVVAEYARLGALARAPLGEVIAEERGLEHLMRARAAGRGAILMGGHFGNSELLGARVRLLHPIDFVVKPLSNPGADALLSAARREAGVGQIDAGTGVRRIYEALRANRWVAMLADQDARGHGVFVPFFGRLASTPAGPARIALATGAPLIMGRLIRRHDGRQDLLFEPPFEVPDPRAPDAALRLTALHTATLERWVRERPELWFWLHRRWKTSPPASAEGGAAAPARRTG